MGASLSERDLLYSRQMAQWLSSASICSGVRPPWRSRLMTCPRWWLSCTVVCIRKCAGSLWYVPSFQGAAKGSPDARWASTALTAAASPAASASGRLVAGAFAQRHLALEGSVQFDTGPWVAPTDAQLLAALLRAVRDACTVSFTYAAPDAPETRRDADVHRVVHLEGRWYAVAHCHLRGARRSFRLDRMSALSVQDRHFTREADLDAAAYLRSTLRAPKPTFEISVWLDCPPEDLRGRVSTWGTELRPDAHGTRLTTTREGLSGFAAFLLGLDCPFRVDSPPELRAEFARLAERCAAHAGPAAASPAYTGA